MGADVRVSDLRQADALTAAMAALAELPVTFVLGGHPLQLLDGADVLAVSGGVPADAPIVQEALRRGIPVTNDSLLFLERAPMFDVVGITGSAGKTTTTALTGALCAASGRRTWVGGNIGHPLIAVVSQMKPTDIAVQELSSFQLEWWNRSPHVAAVLNITPNHLDRHGTMAAYSDAKANILRHQTQGDVAILCADDPGAMALQNTVRGRRRLFSQRGPVEDGAYISGERLRLRDGARELDICALSDVRLRGAHNIGNTLAAATLADSVGVPAEKMREVIAGFAGVPHRLELVSTVGGVQYVNDSIATAPERALAAIASFSEPLVLLAGGRDKNMVWEPWARQVRKRVKHAVLFGTLAGSLASYLDAVEDDERDELTSVTQCTTLAEAVAAAEGLARPGDVVLLAPGGTSYDAFEDFAARGEAFRVLVHQIEKGQTTR
jgi:UDP-N-acetylmuramoylalanine--D-glutamate ligase